MPLRFFILVLLCLPAFAYAQDSSSLYNKAFNLPDKFFTTVERKSQSFQQRVARGTAKYLDKLRRREIKMQRKLAKTDSAAAIEIFGDVNKRYDVLQAGFKNSAAKLPQSYSSYVDSMSTSLNFLKENKILAESSQMQSKLKGVFKNYKDIQSSLNCTDFVEKQIRARQEFLKSKLQSLPLQKQFSEFKKTVYYYKAQVEEYRNVLQNPAKIEAVVLDVVSKVPAFSSFFARHSQLASLFQLPGSNNRSTSSSNGMQTRDLLMQELGQRLGYGPNPQNAVNSNISAAQSSLVSIKEKLSGQHSNGDPDMPDFKPNSQKTKSFLQRLEVGTNVQSTKSNYFFPQTTDLALTAGYKFKPNITAGLGISYKLGLGKDFRHVAISHQGIGLRSYGEIKIKGSFWITGGGELNYRAQFRSFDELRQYSAWQRSVLAGLSKKYAIKNKLKGNLQLLYDFLHNQQKPATQALLFRVGYNLK